MSGEAHGDPFAVTASASACVPRAAFDEALAGVSGAIEAGAPVVILSGPAGLGKTLLLRRLEDSWRGQRALISLPYAALPAEDLAAWALGVLGRASEGEPLRALRDVAAEGAPLVLVLDDGSAIPLATARRLATLASEPGARISIVVAMTDDAKSETVRAALGDAARVVRLEEPMNAAECAAYVAARLARAQAPPEVTARFDAALLDRLYRASRGVPRVLSRLASEVVRRGPGALVDIELDEPPLQPEAPLWGGERAAPATPAAARVAVLAAEAARSEAPAPEAMPRATQERVVSPTPPTPKPSAKPVAEEPPVPAKAEPPVPAKAEPPVPAKAEPPVPAKAEPPVPAKAAPSGTPKVEPPTTTRVAPPPGPPPAPRPAATPQPAPVAASAPEPVAAASPEPALAAASPEPALAAASPEPAVALPPRTPPTPPSVETRKDPPAERVPPTEEGRHEAPPAEEREGSPAQASRKPAPAKPAPDGPAPSAAAAGRSAGRKSAGRGIGPVQIFVVALVVGAAAVGIPMLLSRTTGPEPVPTRAPAAQQATEPAAPPPAAPEAPATALVPPLEAPRPEPPPAPAPAAPPAAPPRSAAGAPAAEPPKAAPVPSAQPAPTPRVPEVAEPAPQLARPIPAAPEPPKPSPVAPPPEKPAPAVPEPAKPAAPPVAVAINAMPWAIIEIDGREVGETPLAGVMLTPGSYVFRARMPDDRVVTRTVEIDARNRFVTFP